MKKTPTRKCTNSAYRRRKVSACLHHYLKALAAVAFTGLAVSTAEAQVIYSEDFASAPVVNTTTNGNSNYAATGIATGLNQNEWLHRSSNGLVAHDAAAEDLDITISNNVYHLIDLSTLQNDPGSETEYTLSFDVVAVSGSASLFAYAGGGLDYNGTSNGHLFCRSYGNPCLFSAGQGATATQVIDGTTTSISSTGSFETTVTLNDVGSAGDYLFIGFTNSGASLTIDNIQLAVAAPSIVTLEVETPDAAAAEELSDPGTIRISRGSATNGDLNVLYALSGTADSSDYSESHSGTAIIPDGSSYVDVVFTPVDDLLAEADETIQLDLTADAAYFLGETTSGVVTIAENDGATILYSNDFTSAPVINTTTNGNSNYAGTGIATELNQNEWLYRSGTGSVTHNVTDGKIDISIGNNIYHLIDLSVLEGDPGDETTFNLSFDVENLTGDVSLFAFAGGGLDYNGTSNGRLYFRTYGNPCTFYASNGATTTPVIDGASTTITGVGRFETSVTLTDLGNAGDYLFLAFANGSESLTIDNLRIEVLSDFPIITVSVPSELASEAVGDSGVVRISRSGTTTGDLNVLYTLGGSADSSDYIESHTGTVTILDGESFVDLAFTPVEDAVFEGYETIQLDIAVDATYIVGSSNSGSITITEASYSGGTAGLTVGPDGSVSLTRNDTGQVVSNLLSEGWSVYNFTDDTRTALDQVTPVSGNEVLVQSADGKFQVNVAITGHDRYLKFELVNVSNTFGGPLDENWPGHRVEFDLKIDTQGDGWMLNTLLLNPMTELPGLRPYREADDIDFRWPYPHLAQTQEYPEPQGAVAVFGFSSDAEYDDILADIWVAEDSLPRPNRANLTSWTKDDVFAWLDLWEAKVGQPVLEFSFSPLGNYEDLFTIADEAYAAGFNRIGLGNLDWQGDSQGDPNATLFPNGVSDVIAWQQYCEARGIDFYTHGFGATVQYDDPNYGRFSNHEGLARSAAGTLVNSVSAGETTLIVQPDLNYYQGMKEGMLPFYQPAPWNAGYGTHFAPYYDTNSSTVRINGQIYNYTVTLTPENNWQVELTDPKSGFQMAAHETGDAVEFLVMGGTNWFIPDPRMPLFEQLAVDYATILNHFQSNAQYDGEGWHRHLGHWGTRKFTQMVYERLDHPSGEVLHFGNFDRVFKRIRALDGGRGSIPFRDSTSTALASSQDDIHYGANQVAGNRDISIRADHAGITVPMIGIQGLWDQALATAALWSTITPLLSSQLADDIKATHDDLYVASETANQWILTKMRAMRRPGIDTGWRLMAERPAVAPRQFFKADAVPLAGLENPYAEQAPVVELHVMADMEADALDNISLMPTSAGMIVNPTGGQQALTYDNGKLVVSYDNSQSSSKYYHWDRTDPPEVGYWTYASLSGGTESFDMDQSRGIQITVNIPAGQEVDGGALVLGLAGGFPRSYIVELDFVGQRTIEIPHGEAINNTAIWKELNSNPTGVISVGDHPGNLFRLYIAGLPAGESTSVEVLDIQAMKEDLMTGLINPVLSLNSDSVTVNGTIPFNHYLVYPGGASAEVYGPNWNFVENLSVTGAGLTALSGTNSFSVDATSSSNTWVSSRIKVSDSANQITFDKELPTGNQPPAFIHNPFVAADAHDGIAYSGTIAAEASDPEGDSMTFVKVSGPAWLSVASNGAISGTPTSGDVGLNNFTVQVDATGGSSTAELRIIVDSDPPVFLVDPIVEANASEDLVYNATIADDASDPEGDPLTFTKVSGPAWLTVAPDGSLGGTPSVSDLGPNSFTVRVSSLGGSDTAMLDITVEELLLAYPTDVVSTTISDLQVDLVWTSSSVGTSYNVKRASSLGGPYTTIATGVTALSYSDRTLVADTTYYYIVTSVDGAGSELADSSPVATTTMSAVTDIGLWYGEVSGNINTTDANPQTSVTINLSETEDSIDGDTTEVYTGEIYDADGAIAFTENIDDKTRLYIDGILVLSSDSWSDRASTGDLALTPGWHTFELRISNGGGGSGPRSAPGFGYDPNGGSNWIHPEDPGDGSLFRRKILSAGDTPPVAPDGLVATDGNGWVSLDWADNIEGDLASYSIYRSTSSDSYGTVIASGVLVSDYTDYSIVNGTTYYYTVTAMDAAGKESVYSAAVSGISLDLIVGPTLSTGTASNITLTGADLAYTLTDDGGEPASVTVYYGTSDGGMVPGNWDQSLTQGSLATGSYSAVLSSLLEGTTYYYTVHAVNSAGAAWGSTGSFTTEADSSSKLVRTTLTGVSSDSWQSVDLGMVYNSAVIIATPIFDPGTSSVPVVTRLTNVSGSSFEVKLDRVDGLTGAVTADVSIVAVEEGVYTQSVDGVTMEAVKFTSTVTAGKNAWTSESRSYQNSYTNPVVVGQVMSANDANWSAFWSMGSSRTDPPSASSLCVGKHVAEDTNTTRADETVGYIVIESGSGTVNGINLTAGVGSDSIMGTGDTSVGYSYTLSGLNSANAAAVSLAGMDDSDGGWAVLYGATPYSSTSLTIAVDEDALGDSERNHTDEQAGYLILE